MTNVNEKNADKAAPQTEMEILLDLRKRMGRIEKHLIDIRGNSPRKNPESKA